MRYYFVGFFHAAIISIFFIFSGCGYKAPPVWEVNQSQEINASDLQIIDLNSTLKVKIGVK